MQGHQSFTLVSSLKCLDALILSLHVKVLLLGVAPSCRMWPILPWNVTYITTECGLFVNRQPATGLPCYCIMPRRYVKHVVADLNLLYKPVFMLWQYTVIGDSQQALY